MDEENFDSDGISHDYNTEDNTDTCEECGQSPVELMIVRNKAGQKMQVCEKCKHKITLAKSGASANFMAMFTPYERSVLQSLGVSDVHSLQVAAKRLMNEVIRLRAIVSEFNKEGICRQ